jgi:hypothetical protein
MKDLTIAKGFVDAVINYKDGTKIELAFPNTVLVAGREALVKTLTNNVGNSYTNLFVNRIIFGDGGTTAGQVKIVETGTNALYGITRASKSVTSQINPNNSTQAIFTSVLGYDDGNGFTLNEMGLVMNNGDLYSHVCFADLTKTSNMSITWNWSISFI